MADSDVVERSDALDAHIDRVNPLRLLGPRLRAASLRGLVIIVALIVGAMTGVALYARHAIQVASSADRKAATAEAKAVANQAAAISGCLSNNEFRYGERILFHEITAIVVAPPDASTQRKAATAQFDAEVNAYVDKVTTLRDCRNLRTTVASPTPPELPSIPDQTTTTLPMSTPEDLPGVVPTTTSVQRPTPSHPTTTTTRPSPTTTTTTCRKVPHTGICTP